MISNSVPTPPIPQPIHSIPQSYVHSGPQNGRQKLDPFGLPQSTNHHKQSNSLQTSSKDANIQMEIKQKDYIPSNQHHIHPLKRSDISLNVASILRKSMVRSKITKNHTIAGDMFIQANLAQQNKDGSKTTRSITNGRSTAKLNTNYIEASLRQEEEIFKELEVKAKMLKDKQKKGRQIIKKICKDKQGLPSPNVTASLSVITPNKSKFSHKRGESCHLPLPEEQTKPSILRSLESVQSEQSEEQISNREGSRKASDELDELKNELQNLKRQQNRQRIKLESKQKQIEIYQSQINRISQELQKQVLQNQKSNQNVILIEQQKSKLLLQLKLLQQKYQMKLQAKQSQIAQLINDLSQKAIIHQQISAKCLLLQQKNAKISEDIQSLKKQQKDKINQYQQNRRQLQKQLIELSQERRKMEQNYLKEIQNLKRKIESHSNQRNSVKQKLQLQQQIYSKQIVQMQQANLAYKEQIGRLNQTISKLTVANQQKSQANQTLQLYLANAEGHIRKVQQKYHSINKQLTEKNLSYDFLWIQLKQEEQKSKLLENRIKKQDNEAQVSILHSSENDSPVKQQGEKGLVRILSSSTLKDIKDLHGMMEESEKRQKKSPIGKEVNLPFTHCPSLKMPLTLLSNSKCLQKIEAQQEAPIEELHTSNSNILLKNDLSEAFSEENDQIYDMVSKQSNGSRLESSLGAFSEYSRVKSTQSALTHKQVETEYQNKLKNNKLMAKLGKFKNKK